MQKGYSNVVEDLALGDPASGVVGMIEATTSLLSIQSVQGVLEVVHCKIGFLHNLVETAKIVVVMWKNPIP